MGMVRSDQILEVFPRKEQQDLLLDQTGVRKKERERIIKIQKFGPDSPKVGSCHFLTWGRN